MGGYFFVYLFYESTEKESPFISFKRFESRR